MPSSLLFTFPRATWGLAACCMWWDHNWICMGCINLTQWRKYRLCPLTWGARSKGEERDPYRLQSCTLWATIQASSEEKWKPSLGGGVEEVAAAGKGRVGGVEGVPSEVCNQAWSQTFFFFNIIYVLSLHCGKWAFSSCRGQGLVSSCAEWACLVAERGPSVWAQ